MEDWNQNAHWDQSNGWVSYSDSLIKKAYWSYSVQLILSLIFTLIGTFIGDYLNLAWSNPFLMLIVAFVFLMFAHWTKGIIQKILFFSFCLLEGVSLTPIIFYYLTTDANFLTFVLGQTLIITVVFLCLGFLMKDLSAFKLFLFGGLIMLLLLSIVEIFTPIPGLAHFGAVLFSLYIAYDINKFKNRVRDTQGDLVPEEITHQVIQQYLNIINLFLQLLKANRKR